MLSKFIQLTIIVHVLGAPEIVVTLGRSRRLRPSDLVHLEEVFRNGGSRSILH